MLVPSPCRLDCRDIDERLPVKSPCRRSRTSPWVNSRPRPSRAFSRPQVRNNSTRTPVQHPSRPCRLPPRRTSSRGPARMTRSRQSNRSRDRCRPCRVCGSPRWVSSFLDRVAAGAAGKAQLLRAEADPWGGSGNPGLQYDLGSVTGRLSVDLLLPENKTIPSSIARCFSGGQHCRGFPSH